VIFAYNQERYGKDPKAEYGKGMSMHPILLHQ